MREIDFEDCTSDLGHDLGFTDDDNPEMKMSEDLEFVLVKVKCFNCKKVLWEEYEKSDKYYEAEIVQGVE